MAKRARKRRIWADDEKRMICHQARLPGVSVSQVARRYDVNANLVFTWLRDARFVPEEVEPPIEVSVDETIPAMSACSGSTTFLPVELITDASEVGSPDAPAGDCCPGAMEIALAGGHRLRIEGAYDPEVLARLVRALSEPAT